MSSCCSPLVRVMMGARVHSVAKATEVGVGMAGEAEEVRAKRG